jgi:hypothetical protein
VPDFLSRLDGALAQDVAALDVELERARALLAVSNNGYELKNMSSQWRADRSVVLAAVRQCGEALRFASSELVQDSAIVLAAVLADPSALRFAARHFDGDKQVVIAAVREDPGVIVFANDTARRDPEVLLHAASTHLLQNPLAAPGVGTAARIVHNVAGDPDLDFSFLRSFDQLLLAQLAIAVTDRLARLGRNVHRDCIGFSMLTGIDIAGWVASKLDRRNALMVFHRGDAQLLGSASALAVIVLEYL